MGENSLQHYLSAKGQSGTAETETESRGSSFSSLPSPLPPLPLYSFLLGFLKVYWHLVRVMKLNRNTSSSQKHLMTWALLLNQDWHPLLLGEVPSDVLSPPSPHTVSSDPSFQECLSSYFFSFVLVPNLPEGSEFGFVSCGHEFGIIFLYSKCNSHLHFVSFRMEELVWIHSFQRRKERNFENSQSWWLFWPRIGENICK